MTNDGVTVTELDEFDYRDVVAILQQVYPELDASEIVAQVLRIVDEQRRNPRQPSP